MAIQPGPQRTLQDTRYHSNGNAQCRTYPHGRLNAARLKPVKRADILVIDGGPEIPTTLIHAKETDIRLVMINGIAATACRRR
jgi:hypothetical protein